MIWVLLQAGGSQWPLVTQQVQYVPGFLPWMLFGWPLLFAQCVELDVHLYYAAIQNLVCRCGNDPQTTAEGSDTPLIHSDQHMHQPSMCPSSFLQTYNSTLFQIAAWDNLSQDDIWNFYDHLHARIHICIVAREDCTMYWCDCLSTSYCDMPVSFGLNLSYTPTVINYLWPQFAIQLRVLHFFFIFPAMYLGHQLFILYSI